MHYTNLTKRGGAPLWALAAPAIGVPLMVMLLAVAVPKHDAGGEHTKAAVEQMVLDGAPQPHGHCAGESDNS